MLIGSIDELSISSLGVFIHASIAVARLPLRQLGFLVAVVGENPADIVMSLGDIFGHTQYLVESWTDLEESLEEDG